MNGIRNKIDVNDIISEAYGFISVNALTQNGALWDNQRQL